MPKFGKKSILEAAKRPEVVNDSIEGVTQKALAGTPVIKTNQHWDAFSLFDSDNPENQEYMQDRKSTPSELQSHSDLVCRLLLEKKKKNKTKKNKKQKSKKKNKKTKT